MALIKALSASTRLNNTGNLGGAALGPSKMFFALPPNLVIPSGTTDIVVYMKAQIHAASASRVYPLFGYSAPLWDVTNNNGQNITETSNYTGEIDFIRTGANNRTYITKADGRGFAFANALNSFRNSGYAFMDIDSTGLYLLVQNSDGSYSGVPALYMGGEGFQPATGTTNAKIQFSLAFDPDAYASGTVFQGGLGLLNLKGLQDAKVLAGSQTQTITNVFVKVESVSTDADLIGSNASLATLGNFLVTDHSGGAPVTVTAVAIVNGEIRLTGTYVSGHSYDVALAAASVLYGNNVFYIEGQQIGTVVIP
jgi:hypothetical protein